MHLKELSEDKNGYEGDNRHCSTFKPELIPKETGGNLMTMKMHYMYDEIMIHVQ